MPSAVLTVNTTAGLDNTVETVPSNVGFMPDEPVGDPDTGDTDDTESLISPEGDEPGDGGVPREGLGLDPFGPRCGDISCIYC